jgi:hypothetical protein
MEATTASLRELRFFGALVTVHIAHDERRDKVSLVESHTPYGVSPRGVALSHNAKFHAGAAAHDVGVRLAPADPQLWRARLELAPYAREKAPPTRSDPRSRTCGSPSP